jgi:ABC-2 type transport system ATP-binding protein
MNDVIVTRDLGKRYRKVAAVDRLSVSIPEGSIYGLLGPNGAGKTTTLDLLMNLQTPSSGEAIVLGTNSRKLKGRSFERIGYLSEAQRYSDWMTVAQLFKYLKPFYPTWDDARASELLSQFRLNTSQKLKHLSRGTRMKALLASVMAYRPKLLVLDEPFSGLDPLTREELIGALLEAATETTVLLSSHDLAEIESFVTHVGYLTGGHLGFSEELPSLTSRFREITVTVVRPRLPDPWPAEWICPEFDQTWVRFIETRFDPARTEEDLRKRFPGASSIDSRPMTLRSIFLALARSETRAEA